MSDEISSGLRDIIARGLSEQDTTYALIDFTLQTRPDNVKDAIRICAIPAWFDAPLLALLSEKSRDEADALLEQIVALSFVSDRKNYEKRKHYIYSGATRSHLLTWWKREHLDRFGQLNDRLVQHYRSVIHEYFRHPTEPDFLEALAALDAEYPNIRVAQAWASAEDNWELLHDYACMLASYFQYRGLWTDWIEWTEAGLESCKRAGELQACAAMWDNLGRAYKNLPEGELSRNLERSIACYCEALRYYTFEEKPLDYARIQNNLGNAYADLPTGNRKENLQKARNCYQEALRVYTADVTPLEYEITRKNQSDAFLRLKELDDTDSMRRTRGDPEVVTWMHLSDLHFRESHNYDEKIILEALLLDITGRISEDGLQPDFVIASGDIAYASRPEEYALAKQFFKDLLKITNLPKDRLFLVPGNHDVDRNEISTLAAGATTVLTDRDRVNRFLANDSDRTVVFRRFHNYGQFIEDISNRAILCDDAQYYYVKSIKVGGRKVAILALNSAWLAGSDNDRNRLILGERQVRDALGATRGAELRLAVMHHPFDWLQDFDNGNVKPILCRDCDFVLHGHTHQVGLLQARTPDTRAMTIAAGACYEARDRFNSYNFVQLDFSEGKGRVYLRMYSDLGGGFWTQDVLNYRNVRNGEYVFSLE